MEETMIKEQELFQKYVQILVKQNKDKKDAEKLLLDELMHTEELLPELHILENEAVVEHILREAVYDATSDAGVLDVSMLTDCLKRLEFEADMSEEETAQVVENFISLLRRLLKQRQTNRVEKLTASDEIRIRIENMVCELDMHIGNYEKDYGHAQALLVDVLRCVQLDELTKGNYERAYAEMFARAKNREACSRCFESMIQHSPMDANLVYGWLLQNLEWKKYAACNTIIAQGLQLEDIEYTDLFLEIAQEIAQLTKDDASYREWKAQYGKKRAALKRMQASILPLPREAYQDAKPNKPCPCGSGKKFKACCGKLIKKLDA